MIDLQPFCDTSHTDPRYDLSEPFVKSGWRVGTDVRIIVAEPSNLPDTQPATSYPGIARSLAPFLVVPTPNEWSPVYTKADCVQFDMAMFDKRYIRQIEEKVAGPLAWAVSQDGFSLIVRGAKGVIVVLMAVVR